MRTTAARSSGSPRRSPPFSWCLDREGRITALTLGGLLVAFAVLVATLIREPATVNGAGSPMRECAALVRLALTSSVSLLYVVALSGMLSIAVFLPVYLVAALHFDWTHALAITGGGGHPGVGGAAARRMADRPLPDPRRLVICYGIAAALCLVVAAAPGRVLPVAAIAGIAACDGVAGGALLALIGKAARPYNVGAVMGPLRSSVSRTPGWVGRQWWPASPSWLRATS